MAEKGGEKPSLTLYKIDGGPPSCALMMLCKIIGLKYEGRSVDFINLEHKTHEYKKINPMGTIPALVDGDFNISESHSAMKYLLAKYGKEHEERLYPSDLETRALVDQCMFFDAGVLFIRLPTVYEGMKAIPAKVTAGVEDGYSVLEAYLEKNKYVATDHLTLADLSLGATTNSLQGIHPLDENKYPRTVEWLARLNNEPFFNISINGSKLLTKLLKSCWEKNALL